MGYWNNKTEDEKKEIWELNQVGKAKNSPDWMLPVSSSGYLPDNLAMTYLKVAESLPDKESVEEMTRWLKSWMEAKRSEFEDYESFKETLLMKGYNARAKQGAENEGKSYSDYCKHISLMAAPQSSVWELVEKPLDMLMFAVLKDDIANGNDTIIYNNETFNFLRNGTRETFWNHVQAGALAHDIAKEFLKEKGEDVPEAEHLAAVVEEKVKAALQGVEDGSIKGTKGTLWIKEGAYMALDELRNVFKGTYQTKYFGTYNGDLELEIATHKVGAVLREAGVEMDVKRVSPEKDEQLSPERMFELKYAWMQALKEKGYETRDRKTGQLYVDKNERRILFQYSNMDKCVLDAYSEFIMKALANITPEINLSEIPKFSDSVIDIKPSEIPAFTDMIKELCCKDGSLLANEGTGQIEFREKMLTETMAKIMKVTADKVNLPFSYYNGPYYTAMLEAFYKDEGMRKIFSAGGVDFDKVFREAVAKTDSGMMHRSSKSCPEKDLRERLESPEGIRNSINKHSCIVGLAQELQNILKDNRTAGEERIENVSFEAIKRQVGEWTKERPIMNELEKNNPGTIKECAAAAIYACEFLYELADMPDLGPKLKDAVSRHFAPDLNSLKQKELVSQNFSQEPTKEEPTKEEPTNEEPMIQRRRIRPVIKDVGPQSEKPMAKSGPEFPDIKEQNTLDIAKNASTPNVRKRPVPQRSKDILSR